MTRGAERYSSHEGAATIQRFTPEARIRLKEAGYVLIPLTEQSIKTARDKGRVFSQTWHKKEPELEALRSRFSQVAVNPDRLFLRGSGAKSFEDQERMVQEFSKRLGIDGVEAVIGTMPDYVDLAFSYLEMTGELLFGGENRYEYTRTRTMADPYRLIDIGNHHPTEGLSIDRFGPKLISGPIHVACILVPTAK